MKNVNVRSDLTPYYSESLGCEVKSRRHRDKIMKERGVRVLEKGEKVASPLKPYTVSEETRKNLSYLKRNGVTTTYMEKVLPWMLPKR